MEWYPSARVRLVIRLEDYGDLKTPAPPDVIATKRRGTFRAQEPKKLQVVKEEGGQLRLAGPEDAPNQTGNPQDQQASKDGYTFVLDGIIPQGASHGRNGIRTADTLNLTLRYEDFPVDPRVVRSCAVTYFAGTVSAEDYDRGMRGEVRREGVQSGVTVPFHVIPDTYTDSLGRPRTNQRFTGWADDWEIEWPDDSSALLSLTCADNTRLLLDQQHPPKMSVGTDKPIDEAFADYLSNFPFARGLAVEYRPRGSGVVVPVLKDVLTKTSYPPGVGPAPNGKDGGNSNVMVWDYLTDIASSLGLSIRVEGNLIIIQRPSTLYGSKFQGRPDDPFQGRTVDGRQLQRRLWLYGQNIQTMRAKRGLTKYAPQNVEVRCYNPARKRTLVARYPTFVKPQKTILPGETADQKFLVRTVQGIGDEDTLRVIAQGVYESQQRRELEFAVVTRELCSFGGGQLDPDALDMEAGDSIDIELFRQNGDVPPNESLAIEEALRTRPIAFMQGLGFPRDFAEAYAKAISNVGYPTTFRVREILTDWDAESEGITITLQVCNYIEVRSEAQLEDDIDPADATTAPTPLTIRDNR